VAAAAAAAARVVEPTYAPAYCDRVCTCTSSQLFADRRRRALSSVDAYGSSVRPSVSVARACWIGHAGGSDQNVVGYVRQQSGPGGFAREKITKNTENDETRRSQTNREYS